MTNHYVPKLSLIALSIGMAMPSMAIECNSPNMEIIGQNNIELSNCKFNLSQGNLRAIYLKNSNNIVVSNNEISVSSKLENNNISEVVGLENSSAVIKDTTISANANNDLDIFILDKAKLELNSVKIAAQNQTTIFSILTQTNQITKNEIVVNNSQLSGEQKVIDHLWDANGGREESQLTLTLNNSSLNAPVLASESGSPDESELIEIINIVANNNSKLDGAIYVGLSGESKINLTLNNSEWIASQGVTYDIDGEMETTDLSISNLTLQDSHIKINKVNDFQTIEIGNLSGNGSFSLNTDLANQKSDQIIVKGTASGDHQLAIQDSGNEPNAANGKVTLVKTSGNNNAKFSLKDRQFVDAGAYRYRLNQEGNDWVLSNRQGEQAQAATTSTDGTGSPSTNNTQTPPHSVVSATPEQLELSEKSNALVSLRQAQLVQMEQSLVGIHQRLGELKQAEKGNVWVRNLNSRSEFDAIRTADNSQSSGFEQTFHGVQIGADAAVSDNWRVGGFVGAERATVDFNGEYGSGKLSGQSFGLYAAYQADNGFYVDNIAKFSRLKAESNATGARRYNAYTLSSEVGKIYTLGNQWSVTPNAQLAWSSIAGKDDEDRLSAVYARFGARLAKLIDVGGWKLQPYAEVNSVTSQNKNSHVRVNQYRFEVESNRGRVETALGVNAATGNHRFGVEAKTAYGKRLDQPFVIQANYRYSY